MAGSVTEAADLIAAAERFDRLLMPGHTFLYSPPVTHVRDLIKSGVLGDVYFLSMSRVNLGLHQPDVSVIWDLAPHDFSILLHWMGSRPRVISAVSRACVLPDVPDVAFIALEFTSGAIAHLELAWLAPSKLRRTAIVGSNKMVVYDDTSSSEPVRVFDSGVEELSPESFGEYRLSYRTGDILSPRIDPAEPLARQVLDFVRSIRTGCAPLSSMAIGLDVVRLVEEVNDRLQSQVARGEGQGCTAPSALGVRRLGAHGGTRHTTPAAKGDEQW